MSKAPKGKLRGGRAKSALVKAMPPGVLEAEKTFHRCPGGHGLPNHTNKGQCTPIYCALTTDDADEETPEQEVERVARGKEKKDSEKELEQKRLMRTQMRAAMRQELVPVPAGLKGGDAEAWTGARLVELSPYAVAEMEFQLKYGDDEQRARAAARVLDSTGHGKKDLATGGATIVINMSGQGAQSIGAILPWRQQGAIQAPTPKTVDANVVEVRPIGALQEGSR